MELNSWASAAHAVGYNMEALAGEAKLSPKQFRRRFQERFDRSPKTLLNEIRANRAALALSAGASPKEVALEFHYRDTAHLHHALKQHLGQTPSQLGATRHRLFKCPG